VKNRLPGLRQTVQSEYRARKELKKTDTETLRTDRIPQEKGSLRRIQETDSTERVQSKERTEEDRY
jgi:hypothetical protein